MNYLLKSIVRRKERLALVTLGILLVALAASLAAATARSTQGTVDEELARHWRTDYDLLIRYPMGVTTLESEWGGGPANSIRQIVGISE